jgi:hypothetical protein
LKLQDSKSKKLQLGKMLWRLVFQYSLELGRLGFGAFAQRQRIYAPFANVSEAS